MERLTMFRQLLRRLRGAHRAPVKTRARANRPQLEPLEDRLLMASGLDVFWNFHGAIAVAGEQDSISAPFRAGDFTKRPLVGYLVSPAPGSNFDPTAVSATQNGSAVVPVLSTDNTGSNLASLILARLKPRPLAVNLSGLGTGGYTLELYPR